MKRLVFLLACIFVGMEMMIAQDRQVAGTVVDERGEPVIGASVAVRGTTTGTVTGLDGKFVLNVSESATALTVQYLGMRGQEVAVASNVSVVLSPVAGALDEVIVIAYGTARKSSFTGSAVTIKADDLEKRKVSNVTKALDGLSSGVQVTSGSGQPGEGSRVYIRGLGSINASNTPLYVVDGIPYDGSISAINPNDIETMTILKDASAGALYGSRGANGVVMITTKKGKNGVTEVNFRANFGVSGRAIPRYETMNSKEFIEANYSAFYNDEIKKGVHPDVAGDNALYQMSKGAQRIFGNQEQYNPYNFPVTELIDPVTGLIRSDARLLWEDDWLDEVTRNDASRQEYTMDVNGGVERMQYMLSFGYLKDNGILKTTDFKRYTGRANIEAKPVDWMAVGLEANYAQTKTNSLEAIGFEESNVWLSAQLMGPIYPVYQRDPATGSFMLDEFGERMFDYGLNRPSGASPDFNTIATLYDDKYSATNNTLSSRGHVDFGDTKDGWAKGLKLSFNLGFDYYGNNELTYLNPFFGNAANSKGRVAKGSVTALSYTANQLLSYKKTLNDLHNFDVMAAHEYYSYEYSLIEGEKTGFPFGGLYEPDAASSVTGVTGYSDKYRIESYLGRINYDYDDKYYLSAGIRSDASSRFHKDFRWKSFWSIGGNYRISKEDFMQAYSSWLDNLAVKISYGYRGNDNLLKLVNEEYVSDYYPWQAMYDLGWTNANEPGALVQVIENQGLSWEKSAMLNAGLDASFWGSRLQVELEWYRRETTDLLLDYPKALSTGFSGYSRNSGSMLNTGFELTLAGRIIKTQDLEWNVILMGSTLRNKVLKLTDDGQDIITGSRIIREGEPYNSYYLVRSAGVDPMTGDPLFWTTVDDEGNKVDPYITNNSVLANASRYVAGNRFPSVFGSLSTGLIYKSFDFSIATNYSLGGKMIDNIYQNQLMSFYYTSQAKHKDLLRAWRKPGDITDIPRYDIGASTVYTDDMLINASYFSIKNINLGYTFPSRIAKKVGFKALRIYGVADNLCLFTYLKGMDPQYSVVGGTDYVYTPTRTLSFGIDLKF